MVNEAEIQANLRQVQERVAEAALRGGREPDEVRLMAVSKLHPVDAVLAAYAAGQRDFGENRVEEGARKLLRVAEQLEQATAQASPPPQWHMIGHVQRRKVRTVIEFYDSVHSVDRQSLAEKLSRQAAEAGRAIPVLLECNVSGEASKYGYDAAGWEREEAVREAFFTQVAEVLALPALEVRGLMTMAPLVEDPEEVRPVFASLRRLRNALQGRFPKHPWIELSMGMTNDFEVAVEEGATWVRIGTAIFGKRA